MAASANRRKQDDKYLEILRELISTSGNKYCLDCNQRGPTYVNTTIGSFVCSKCSGMLRGLTPPHRVKSISMATFTPEEIEHIKSRGNDYCKRIWLGLYEGESVNFADEQSVKDFMSDKYEKKRYYLEPSSNSMLTNGNSFSSKSKSRSKGSDAGTASTLISISTPSALTATNNNVSNHTAKVMNNLQHGVSVNPIKVARPVNNMPVPLVNNINAVPNPVPPSVPDFPVDFSTANIYNGSQSNNNNINNNFMSQTSNTMVNGFNSPPNASTASNDRYAALADLDLALRQQNLQYMEDQTVKNKNPFQTNPTDIPSSKNPFFNGGWSTTTASPMPVNPFMPSANNGGFVNSNNPFL